MTPLRLEVSRSGARAGACTAFRYSGVALRLLWAAGLLLAAALRVSAQQTMNPSIALGLATGGGSMNPTRGVGFHLAGAVAWHPPLHRVPWSVRAEATFTSVPWQDRDADGAFGSNAPDRLDVLGLTGNVIWAATLNENPLRPYIIGGAGFYSFDQGAGRSFHLGVNGGAGVWFDTASDPGYLELRLHELNGIENLGLMDLVVGFPI